MYYFYFGIKNMNFGYSLELPTKEVWSKNKETITIYELKNGTPRVMKAGIVA